MPAASAGTGTPGGSTEDHASGLEEVGIRALIDAAPDGILLADEQGSVLFANHEAETMFGYDPDGLVGRSVDDLLPERLQQVHRAHRTRYRAEPRRRSMGAGLLLHGRRTDGSEFPVEISLSPLTTEAGLRVVAVVRDVSDRIAAEARQREVSEALDATRDAVLVLDAATLSFTYVNEGAVEQVGYSRDQLLEMTMLHIAPDFDERSVRELLVPMVKGETTSIVFTTVHRHRDGTDIPVEILMQAIPDEEGTPQRYVKIVRDVRERLETEQRLKRAEQHLRIVEDRERIARDLHDVVIQKLFAAGMVVQSVAARNTDAEHSARLHRVVDDLDDTIKEIRSVIFSLQSDGRDQPGLRASVLRVVDEEREVLGFEPRIRFDGAVDATSEHLAAELLPALREALSNVARHARATAVEIDIEHLDGAVTLRVVDNGVGVSATGDGGNGIRNLATRAEKLGGRCLVADGSDGGTVLDWQVPDG
jgi:PAS domain S-box-containing protein